ncbi:MAG TPA: type II toxin-antitoxin system PemK/MazF family toxin [Chthoniobacteraceae bacterium]|nr:type II toxin-antitoxin system PemK/MazF family toxin [Chthoniobacteraceae bacterium]
MRRKMKPRRGEVWRVDFGIVVKVRPALVLSTEIDEKDRVVVGVVPHTTSVRGSRFEAAVSAPFLESGAFGVQGLAGAHPRQFLQKLGELKSDQMRTVENVVRLWLGL